MTAETPTGVDWPVELQDIEITFQRPSQSPLQIVDGLNLTLTRGAITCIAGRSGSGKTSILRVAAGLVAPTSGRVSWNGQPLRNLNRDTVADLRRAGIGIVDQRADLIPELTTLENVLLPAIPGRRAKELTPRATALLTQFGLAERTSHRPAALSGGERGRACLARAMLLTPPVLIADEPTAGLDRAWADTVINQLRGYARDNKAAVLVASHDPHLIAAAAQVVPLEDAGGFPHHG